LQQLETPAGIHAGQQFGLPSSLGGRA